MSSFFRRLRLGFTDWVSEVQLAGSGFRFVKFIEAEYKLHVSRALEAMSYLEINFKSRAIINIRNKDNKCFLYCILAKMYPAGDHPQRPSKYLDYVDDINMGDIEYPVSLKDIPKVERLNEFLSINVYGLNDLSSKESLYPIYISNHSDRIEIVDLLYIEKEERTHYILIKSLNKFMYDRVNNNSRVVCRRCLSLHRTKAALDHHQTLCGMNEPARQIMSNDPYTIFKNHHFKVRLPFVIYCDFESCNIPMKKGNIIAKQEVNSFGLLFKSDYQDVIEDEYITYTGKDCMKKYVVYLMCFYEQISLCYRSRSNLN